MSNLRYMFVYAVVVHALQSNTLLNRWHMVIAFRPLSLSPFRVCPEWMQLVARNTFLASIYAKPLIIGIQFNKNISTCWIFSNTHGLSHDSGKRWATSTTYNRNLLPFTSFYPNNILIKANSKGACEVSVFFLLTEKWLWSWHCNGFLIFESEAMR